MVPIIILHKAPHEINPPVGQKGIPIPEQSANVMKFASLASFCVQSEANRDRDGCFGRSKAASAVVVSIFWWDEKVFPDNLGQFF